MVVVLRLLLISMCVCIDKVSTTSMRTVLLRSFKFTLPSALPVLLINRFVTDIAVVGVGIAIGIAIGIVIRIGIGMVLMLNSKLPLPMLVFV